MYTDTNTLRADEQKVTEEVHHAHRVCAHDRHRRRSGLVGLATTMARTCLPVSCFSVFAFAIYTSLKWLTLMDHLTTASTNTGRALGYLLMWVNMVGRNTPNNVRIVIAHIKECL